MSFVSFEGAAIVVAKQRQARIMRMSFLGLRCCLLLLNTIAAMMSHPKIVSTVSRSEIVFLCRRASYNRCPQTSNKSIYCSAHQICSSIRAHNFLFEIVIEFGLVSGNLIGALSSESVWVTRKIRFCSVDRARALCFAWLQMSIWSCLPLAHFEEAVEDDEEFCDIGRNKSTTFCTLATDFLTEFLADKHCLRNFCHPKNCDLLVCNSL